MGTPFAYLNDDEDRVASAQISHIAVHSGNHVRDSLADGNQNT
jgi:hypothetical protein